MPRSYIQTTYQIVFATKYRQKVLWKKKRDALHAYMAQTVRNHNCLCFAVGGVEDHVHIVCTLHPSVRLADLVKDVKLSARAFIKEHQEHFPAFVAWQRGYFAATYTADLRGRLIGYVGKQERHHRSRTSEQELRMLLEAHGVHYDEQYFE